MDFDEFAKVFAWVMIGYALFLALVLAAKALL